MFALYLGCEAASNPPSPRAVTPCRSGMAFAKHVAGRSEEPPYRLPHFEVFDALERPRPDVTGRAHRLVPHR